MPRVKVTTYHSGPPPSEGWWPTGKDEVRWWYSESEQWSIVFYSHDMRSAVSRLVHHTPSADVQKHIRWTERPKSWPKRSFT